MFILDFISMQKTNYSQVNWHQRLTDFMEKRGRAFLLPRLTQFLLIICKVYIKAHQTVRSTQIKTDLKDMPANRPSYKPISAEIINEVAIVTT